MPDLGFYDSHADLYDLAFSWDVEGEVAWLLDRFGPGVRSVLEPACGNGRLFPGFERRGIAAAGVDLSREMLLRAAAHARRAGVPEPLLVEADMRDFELGRTFDGAFCPVNTFGYLRSDEDAVRHLACMARHLAPGRRYLVQSGLRDLADYRPLVVNTTSQWTVDTPRGRLETTWRTGDFDPATRVETQVSRFEWISGPEAGRVVESSHAIRLWDWASWSAVVAASPLSEVAAWDGDFADRPRVDVDRSLEGRLLAWHELVA